MNPSPQTSRQVIGVLLAAGQGKRMRTDLPKVAHTLLGKPMILWAADAMIQSGIKNLVVVISPSQKVVENIIQNARFPKDCAVRIAYQDKAMGTGHATACALPAVQNLIAEKGIDANNAEIVIGFGDVPAFAPESFLAYYEHHIQSKNTCTVLAFQTQNPTGYGRVLTTSTGEFQEIRECKDCSPEQKKVTLCNSGFLCVSLQSLANALPQLKPNNAAGEYYLTDVPVFVMNQNKKVGVFAGIQQAELEGVNSQAQLAAMAQYLQNRVISKWMENGVQFVMPHCTYVEPSVTFEPGVIVEPFCFLAGNTHFGANSRVSAGSSILDGKNSKI
jgi:bifunctional UDP-N-acetylglucosamine pyrophosphorylase/glucosamine-1-phosphate N-acetyltransferase